MTTAQLIPHLPALPQTHRRQTPAPVRDTSSLDTRAETAISETAILQGDQRAFTRLVHKESPRLFSMILRIVQDEDEARSVLQETFLQSLERLPTFRGDAKLTTWIYAIGLNLARAARRKASRVRVLEHSEFEELEPAFSRGLFKHNPRTWDMLDRLESADRKRLVHDAIQRLPEQHRLIIQLKDIDGWATEDVSRMLNISHVAVRVRLHRARQALRTLLAPYFSGVLVS